jgi:hypothetical protein
MARVGPISLSDGSVRIPYHLSRPCLNFEEGEIRLTHEQIRALPARSLKSFGNSEYDEVYTFHVPPIDETVIIFVKDERHFQWADEDIEGKYRLLKEEPEPI